MKAEKVVECTVGVHIVHICIHVFAPPFYFGAAKHVKSRFMENWGRGPKAPVLGNSVQDCSTKSSSNASNQVFERCEDNSSALSGQGPVRTKSRKSRGSTGVNETSKNMYDDRAPKEDTFHLPWKQTRRQNAKAEAEGAPMQSLRSIYRCQCSYNPLVLVITLT